MEKRDDDFLKFTNTVDVIKRPLPKPVHISPQPGERWVIITGKRR